MNYTTKISTNKMYEINSIYTKNTTEKNPLNLLNQYIKTTTQIPQTSEPLINYSISGNIAPYFTKQKLAMSINKMYDINNFKQR